MGKGEIARYEQFLLFSQCFQKACFPGASKGIIVWEWVNMLFIFFPEFAEVSVQDEGGDPNKASVEKNEASRQPTRQSKNLEPVVETGDQEFTDVFDLADEESWVCSKFLF